MLFHTVLVRHISSISMSCDILEKKRLPQHGHGGGGLPVAVAPGGRPGSPARRRLRSRPPAALARSIPRVCLHPSPIPSPWTHSQVSFAHTACMASPFLVLCLPASPRPCAPAHLTHASSTLPPRLLRLPSPGPCHYPLPPSRRLRRSQPQPSPSPRIRRARVEPLPLPVLCLSTPSPPRSLARARLDPSTLRCTAVSHPSMFFLCQLPLLLSLCLLCSLQPCSAQHPTLPADLLPI